MKAEDTLQYMADFYPDIFPTRKHALNYLFCVTGNGFEWVNGELVDKSSKYFNRYKLIEDISKADFPNEADWYKRAKFFEELYKDEPCKIPYEYHFEWYELDEKNTELCNYPKNIKPDWLGLIEECKRMMIADRIKI